MADTCPVDGPVSCCTTPADPRAVAAWWRIGIGALIAVNSMTVDLAFNTSEASLTERHVAHGVALGAALVTLALLGWPLLAAAARELRRRRITLEAMFVAGIVGALTASVVAMLTGVGAVYFEIVSILLVVYSFGQQIGRAAQERAVRAAEAWAPELTTCDVVDGAGAVTTIPVSELREGQRVRVRPGSTIAADGIVLEGEGFVREAEMTGELFAAVRGPGDRVWAGTHSVDAAFVVEATAAGGRRRIDGIVDAVERARLAPSSLQRRADRLIAWFLPAVAAVALATMAGWTWARGWHVGLFNAMAVLLVACPCALGLATPVAVWSALSRLARRGLIVRGGDAVERLAAVDTAVFDKTGTLTESRATLAGLVVAGRDEERRSRVLALLEAVERAVDHPVAAAFVGVSRGGAGRFTVEALRLLPAVGVAASVREGAGRVYEVRIGTPERLLADDGARQAWRDLRAWEGGERGRDVVALVDGRVAAAALVAERVRDTWPEAVEALSGLGVRLVVMTGDLAARARALGVTAVHAGLSPEEKLARVQVLRRAGRRVLFVGDGVNDAAAMAASDVSVGVASGAELAAEVADVSWHGGDLTVLPEAVATCRGTVRTIVSNLRLAAVYNLTGVALAAAGVLHPVVAALLMTASSLVVTWRAAELAGGDAGAEEGAAAVPPLAVPLRRTTEAG